MGLLRYTASADNTIVNAYKLDLQTRATGSNAGLADIVETYSIFGRINSSSQELSRILMKFPTTQIAADRSAGNIPASGSVSFYLRLFNAPHSRTVPVQYKLTVAAVSQSWEEGVGLDLEGYTDKTNSQSGSDWIQAKKGSNWTDYKGNASPGGLYSTASGEVFSQFFSSGLEDIELDISELVERWLGATSTLAGNYGVGIMFSSSYEASASQEAVDLDSNVIYNPNGETTSNYTKRFFARGTQYFFKRPVIEARWDSTIKDQRSQFFFSSSRAPAADNLNTVYLYNVIRGRLVDIPDINQGDTILVSLYSGSADNSSPSGSELKLYNAHYSITGGHAGETGIYSCSLGIVSSAVSPLYDVWHKGGKQYFTGSITPMVFDQGMTSQNPTYYINISNMKNYYCRQDTSRFNLYVREKDWKPNSYVIANGTYPSLSIRSASYGVVRLIDNTFVIPYGTGSDQHTALSHDVSGNYFNFDMSLLESGYAYGFKFVFYDDIIGSYIEQDDIFKFWLEEK